MMTKRLNVRNNGNFTNEKYNIWMKNPQDRVKIILDTVGEKFSEPEDTARETSQHETYGGKKILKCEQNPVICAVICGTMSWRLMYVYISLEVCLPVTTKFTCSYRGQSLPFVFTTRIGHGT